MNGYFDHNATTPMFQETRGHYARLLTEIWHNPSSLYPEAAKAKEELEHSREWLADFLGIDEPARVIFTSGATESNNAVLAHAARQSGDQPVIISTIEHPSILAPSHRFFPDRVILSPVNEVGEVDLDRFAENLETHQPCLVSVMMANNETGVIQPWEPIRDLCRAWNVPFHADATQWFGKLPSGNLGSCDWLTGSAHKFGGPKGIGFLIVPERCEFLLGAQTGGPQEQGLRGGTENVPAISAMIAALQWIEREFRDGSEQAKDRGAFERQLLSALPDLRLVGENASRLWNTSMVIVPKHQNLKWLTRLADLGFQVSTGSACSSGKGNPSHVMEAMGLDFAEMGRVLRISGGWETTTADWEALGEGLLKTWKNLDVRSSPSRKKITL